jgi:hypothetical protein
MSDPLLDFAIDLSDVRDRLRSLSYFTDVQDMQEATLDLENLSGIPPLAYVSTVSETAEENKTTGGWSQRVTSDISVLFCVPAERADERPRDVVEDTRKAVIRILVGWQPKGAEYPLAYVRFLLRASRDGLVWAEVITRTTYFYRLA